MIDKATVILAFGLCSTAAAQGGKPPPQADIDRAVEEGARFLLASWDRDPGEHSYKLVNTGFAILFLKRTVAGMPTPTHGGGLQGPDVPTEK